MGVLDEGCKKYFGKPERFSALCNYYFFNHDPVIRPDDITDTDTAEVTGHSHQKTRDLLRKVTVGGETDVGIRLCFVGLETENYVNYAEAVKIMGYDFGRYDRQVQDIRKKREEDTGRKDFLSPIGEDDRLIPVVTLVLCLTDDDWNGPRSLHDMLRIPNSLKDYVSDYRLNVINPKQMSDNDISRFPPDLRAFLDFVRHSGSAADIKKFIDKNSETYKIIDRDTYDMINLYSGNKLTVIEEGGECRVCRGIDELIEQSIAEGEARGIAEGKTIGIAEGKTIGIAEGKTIGIAEGEARGKVSSVDELMKNSGIELVKACAMLSMTVEEYNNYRLICGAAS